MMAVHKHAAAKRQYTIRPRSGPVTTTRLHPMAEELALHLAHGDRNRWIVLSATSVIITNHPRGVTK